MSFFEALISQDIDLFLNADEIGEVHTIEGKRIKCVLEDATLKGSDGWRMLSEATVKLYFRTSDLPRRRTRGETLHIDGVGYEIITWTVEKGMTKVELQSKEVR